MDCSSQLANIHLERLDGVDESATPSEVNGNDARNTTDEKSAIVSTEINDNNGEQDDDDDGDGYDSKGMLPSSYQQVGAISPPANFRKRCDSTTTVEDGDQNESKVLVIYTGGTIGMIRNNENSKYKYRGKYL